MTYNATITLPGVADMAALLDALADYHPALSEYPRRHTEVIITVPGESLRQATQTALAVVEAAAGVAAGRVEVLPTVDFDRRVQADPVPELVSVTEAAAALGVSRQAVLQRIETGSLPARKVGSTWVLPRSAVA